jgi:DNA (cytosine-5)-methyltransferase 1
MQPVVDGYVLDIRFRMLQPKELAAATGFPKNYKFLGTKTEVVKQIGNAVVVDIAKALCVSLLTSNSQFKKAHSGSLAQYSS